MALKSAQETKLPGRRVTIAETGCAVSPRWEFDVKSEVNGGNFLEVIRNAEE